MRCEEARRLLDREVAVSTAVAFISVPPVSGTTLASEGADGCLACSAWIANDPPLTSATQSKTL